jgi:hypothetical protein
VNVGCQILVAGQVVANYPQFAPQPYVMRVQGQDCYGDDRHFQVGVAFDNGRFSVRIADVDNQIQHDGYTAAAQLASADVQLLAPNTLGLTWGDPAGEDPVVQVQCRLTAP